MKITTLIYRAGKRLLHVIPLKKEVFTALKAVYIPPKKVRRELKFNGVFKVKIDGVAFKIMNYDYKHHTLENDIFWLGMDGWEPHSAKIWIKLCKDSKVILDIGANTGVYSLMAAAANPSSVIYGFEPVKRIFAKYTRNLSVNNFNTVTSEMIALSDSNGTATLYDFSEEVPVNATLNKNWGSEYTGRSETTVPTEKLETYIERKGIQQIDLMKIDVELHEPEVLAGMGKYLAQFRPTMLIEIFNETMWDRLMKIISGLDYLYFFIDEDGTIRKITKFEEFKAYNFLFCNEKTAKKLNLI